MANLHEITITCPNPIGHGYINRLMLIDVDSILTVEERLDDPGQTYVRIGSTGLWVTQSYKDFVKWLSLRVRVNDPVVPQYLKSVASHT